MCRLLPCKAARLQHERPPAQPGGCETELAPRRGSRDTRNAWHTAVLFGRCGDVRLPADGSNDQQPTARTEMNGDGDARMGAGLRAAPRRAAAALLRPDPGEKRNGTHFAYVRIHCVWLEAGGVLIRH